MSSEYEHICEHCGTRFNIRDGEGWGRSYFKKGAMLPSTVYECEKCMWKDKKMDETLKILEGEETNDPDESRVLRDE